MKEVLINNIRIGNGHPACIIAEVGQAHDGSLGMAHAYIDLAAEIGVDIIKFQTHFADQESTLEEPFRINFSYEDKTRYEYWKRMEFTERQWLELGQHAKDKNITFLSTAFSIKAVEVLSEIGMPAWKIGSGEIESYDLVSAMCDTGKPILISTGLCDFKILDKLINLIKNKGNDFCIFQCTTKYPSSYEEIGLNVIDELKHRYDCPAGLSDHSGSIFSSITSMAKGANIIEAHITFNKSMFGPDTKASLNKEDFQLLIEARNAIHLMEKNPIDKNIITNEMKSMRNMFGKSAALKMNMEKGTILTRDMLTSKKPSTGIPEKDIDLLVGKKINKDICSNQLLKWTDLDE